MSADKTLSRIFQTHKTSFSKASVTAFTASVVDFSILYCLVEFLKIYYVAATSIAAFLGALTNFTANKYWAFKNDRVEAIHIQGFRYALVSGGSLLLNTLLVYCFTEFGHLRYMGSKTIAALVVGWGWNYPLHRFFVFPESTQSRQHKSR